MSTFELEEQNELNKTVNKRSTKPNAAKRQTANGKAFQLWNVSTRKIFTISNSHYHWLYVNPKVHTFEKSLSALLQKSQSEERKSDSDQYG